nr:G protein-coupled receptor [Proales similis]
MELSGRWQQMNKSGQLVNMSYFTVEESKKVFEQMASFSSQFVFNSNELTYSPGMTVLIALFASMVAFVTITGNVFVIVAFIIEKSLRKYSNYFILNLSIADLLIGLLIPFYTPFLLYNHQWMFGRIACTIWLVLDYVVCSASVLCIVVISMDRYLMVSRGLDYMASQKLKKAMCIMAAVWLIAFLNYAPAIVLWEYIAGKRTVQDGECKVEFHNNLIYLTVTACVEFFAPLLTICSLNFAVYLNIRERSRGLIRSTKQTFVLKSEENDQKPATKPASHTTANEAKPDESVPLKGLKAAVNQNEGATTSSSGSSSYDENVDKKCAPNEQAAQDSSQRLINSDRAAASEKDRSFSTNGRDSKAPEPKMTKMSRSSLNRDKKAARSLFILVFVFFFCWAPYTLLTLIKSVCATCVNENVYELSFWLLWFNSTVNPILYSLLHVKFRHAFLRILNFLFCCNSGHRQRSRSGRY